MASRTQDDNRITRTAGRYEDVPADTATATKVVSGSDVRATVEEKELGVPSAGSATPPGLQPVIIQEADYPQASAYAFTTWKKWRILIVVFLVQCSMNFNTSLYANGQKGMAHEFGITEQTARAGAGAFLVLYGFGCEL